MKSSELDFGVGHSVDPGVIEVIGVLTVCDKPVTVLETRLKSITWSSTVNVDTNASRRSHLSEIDGHSVTTTVINLGKVRFTVLPSMRLVASCFISCFTLSAPVRKIQPGPGPMFAIFTSELFYLKRLWLYFVQTRIYKGRKNMIISSLN